MGDEEYLLKDEINIDDVLQLAQKYSAEGKYEAAAHHYLYVLDNSKMSMEDIKKIEKCEEVLILLNKIL